MAETTTTAETAAETTLVETPPETTEETKPAETEALPESIKAILDKERKAARDADRRARAAEKKAQEYEDRDKSETEKAAARAERAEQRADDAEKRLIRMQVALEKKVPADLMEFLSGDNRQEVEQKADALMAHLKPASATDFDSGARETVEERKTPEEEHRDTLMTLLGRSRAQ